jgi:predicted ATPase
MLVLGDLEGLERDSAALASYCAEKRVEQIRLLASFHHAYARTMREPVDENIALLRPALVAVRESGGNAGNSIMICNLAAALLTAGDLAGAEAALEDGFAFVAQSGEHYWLADLHRLQGQAALKRPEPEPKPVSSRRSKSPAARKRACFNCAPPPISPGCRATPGRTAIPARCWSRSWPRSRAANRRVMSGMPVR